MRTAALQSYNGRKWLAFAESVVGASHIAANKPNQDSLTLLPDADTADASAIIIAISDGHGGDRYCRSEVGAQFATEECSLALRDFVETLAISGIPASSNNLQVEIGRTCRRILSQWRVRIGEDVRAHPFTERERDLAGDNAVVAYGATLVACVLAADYRFYLRVGDGDILLLDADACVREAFDRDPHSVANETASLSTCVAALSISDPTRPEAPTPNALRSVSHHFDVSEQEPAAILLTTDGYSNSFATPSGFHQALLDFNRLGQTREGQESLRKHLRGWLEETSASGSGDDITLGLLVQTPSDS